MSLAWLVQLRSYTPLQLRAQNNLSLELHGTRFSRRKDAKTRLAWLLL
jgi:hypothetical protein